MAIIKKTGTKDSEYTPTSFKLMGAPPIPSPPSSGGGSSHRTPSSGGGSSAPPPIPPSIPSPPSSGGGSSAPPPIPPSIPSPPSSGGNSTDNQIGFRDELPGNTYTDTGDDISRHIEDLKEAQKRARIAALDAAKANALSNLDNAFTSSQTALDKESATIAPTYYDARNRAAAQSDIGAMNFAQYMAARGVKGASAGMPEIYREAGLQGQVGALDRQESADKTDIERRRTEAQKIYDTNKLGISNAYEADVANAEADIDAQALQTYIDQMNADRMFDLQKEQADRNYETQKQQYQDTLTQQNRKNYEDTAGQYAADYQAQINNILNDNDPENDWQADILGNLRQHKMAAQQAEQKKAEEKAAALRSEAEKEQWNNALDLWKALGTANQDIAGILGVSVGAKTADYNLKSMKTDSDKLTTTEQKNQDFSNAYTHYKSGNVSDAINNMLADKAVLISRFGPSGFKSMWDTVLADAIRAGQAQSYDDYFAY